MTLHEYLQVQSAQILNLIPSILHHSARLIIQDAGKSTFIARDQESKDELSEVVVDVLLELYAFLKTKLPCEASSSIHDEILAIENWFLTVPLNCKENLTPLKRLLQNKINKLKRWVSDDNELDLALLVSSQCNLITNLAVVDLFIDHLGTSDYVETSIALSSILMQLINKMVYFYNQFNKATVQPLSQLVSQIPTDEWLRESVVEHVDSMVTSLIKINQSPLPFTKSVYFKLVDINQKISSVLPVELLIKQPISLNNQFHLAYSILMTLLKNIQYDATLERELSVRVTILQLFDRLPSSTWLIETKHLSDLTDTMLALLVAYFSQLIVQKKEILSPIVAEKICQLLREHPEFILKKLNVTNQNETNIFLTIALNTNRLFVSGSNLFWFSMVIDMITQQIPLIDDHLMTWLEDKNHFKKELLPFDKVFHSLSAIFANLFNYNPSYCLERLNTFPLLWQELIINQDCMQRTLLDKLPYFFQSIDHPPEKWALIFSRIDESNWNQPVNLPRTNSKKGKLSKTNDGKSINTVMESTLDFFSKLLKANALNTKSPIIFMINKMSEFSHETWWFNLLEDNPPPIFHLADLLKVTCSPTEPWHELKCLIARVIRDIIIKTPTENLKKYQKLLNETLPALSTWDIPNQEINKILNAIAPKPKPKIAPRVPTVALRAPKQLSIAEQRAYMNQLNQLTVNALSKQSLKTKKLLFDFMGQHKPLEVNFAVFWLDKILAALKETQDGFSVQLLHQSVEQGLISKNHFQTNPPASAEQFSTHFFKQLISVLYQMMDQPIASPADEENRLNTLLVMVELMKLVGSNPLCWDTPLYSEENGNKWPHVMFLIEALYVAPKYCQLPLAEMLAFLVPLWSECMWLQDVLINDVPIDSPLRMFVIIFSRMPENKAFLQLLSLGLQFAPYEAWRKCGSGDEAKYSAWRMLSVMAYQGNQDAKQIRLLLLEKFPDLKSVDCMKTAASQHGLFKSEVTALSLPTFRGLSAGSSDGTRSLDSADKPRNVGSERVVTFY